MGLLNAFITILAIKILFLEVNIWHVDATFLYDLTNPVQFISPSTIAKCNTTSSHKFRNTIAYEETYEPYSSFNQFKRRHNDGTEWRCCPGYVRLGSTCVPHCPLSCVNGTCKEPYVCTCNKGYQMSSYDDEGPCVPKCTNGCGNGTCTDPEVCSCNKGWINSNGSCRPACGIKCEQNHGYCSEPHVCTCHYGYRKTDNDSSSFTCEPICNNACINGRCASPNVCICADGYEADGDEYPFTCKPKCDEPCVFGTCTAGKCTCNHGYKAVNASVCEPICSESCKNGTCIAPDSCSCNEGYAHRDNISKFICVPICKTDCGNGKCTAPGSCTCDEGFDYNEKEGMCKPHCMKPCGLNAECTSPNNCACSDGYKLNLNSSSAMENSLLTSRVIFFTYTFHKLMEMKVIACQPICNFTCINGECTAPNVCTCDTGYYPSWITFQRNRKYALHSKRRVCLSFSSGRLCNGFSWGCGKNEMCHESGMCTCYDGYVRDTDNFCVPFCVPECSNGTCVTPNRCECHDGFTSLNGTFCKPICERGCQNGDCIGPNHCICHDDFVPNPNHHLRPECIPECTRNCSGHGECVLNRHNDYICECHFGWIGQNCDQPITCIMTMAYDHDNVNRITIRNDTNTTILRAYESVPYCQCNKTLDKKTLCYMMQFEDDNTTSSIGCLLDIDLPCYMTSRYDALINDTKIIWPFVTIAILLATGLTTIAYLKYRRHQKKKRIAVSVGPLTNMCGQESIDTEFLVPEQ